MKRETIINLRQAYAEGRNITQILREQSETDTNSLEAIEIAYDLQTGSYIAAMDKPDVAAYIDAYSSELAWRIADIDPGVSIMDVGTGEGTTFAAIIAKNNWQDKTLGAFDLSLSRALYAREFLKRHVGDVTLFVSDISEIPLATDSVDTIVSSHALEPNGGREKELLSELYRVCARYLVLLEPTDELGNAVTQARMKEFGYVSELRRHAEELGYDVVRYELMDNVANPKNQTGLLVIAKGGTAQGTPFTYTSPGTDVVMEIAPEHDGSFYFSADEGLAYPRVAGIPYLRRDHAIPASKYGTSPFAD